MYQATDDLLQSYDFDRAMHKVENAGIEAGIIDPGRQDGRLFTQGPPDLFRTIRETQLTSSELDTEEMPAVQMESEFAIQEKADITNRNSAWLEGIDTLGGETNERQTVENPYWRMETLRVNNPDGEQIGHALQMVVYPNIEQPSEANVAPDIPADEPFQILEMAHFETPEDADTFSKEFRGYLVPGLLNGPELAEEVTRLEEHPVEWKTLERQELKDYRNLNYVVTHDTNSWKLYNPNEERDVRLRMEGAEDDIQISKSEIKLNSNSDDTYIGMG